MSSYRLKYGQWEVLLKDQELVVGRGTDCDLRLDDPAISRRHAVIYEQRGSIMVKDCSSRNGVYVDGVRLRGPTRVPVGAQLRMGKHQIQVVSDDTCTGDSAVSVFTLVEDPEVRTSAAMGSGPVAALSDRERQVISMIARGFTQREAADAMDVSVKTVEGYLKRVRDKLRVKTRADLVAYAQVAGIVSKGDVL